MTGGLGGRGLGSLRGGTGGPVRIAAGNGGSNSNGPGGPGGSITLQPGAGGVGSPSGSAGNVNLAPTGGKVGIGETSPANTLEVKVGGTTLADSWTIRSSLRWKTNVRTLDGALEKVERLRGVSYDSKAGGKHEIGVIAEEVGMVLPEVVSYEENGVDAQGVDYGRLAALLIEAVKLQETKIQSQEAKIQQLTSKIEQLLHGVRD
jgi:hypothetical protein